MVDLCHLTENLFDKLRRNELTLNASIMDAILEATGVVRTMFDELGRGSQPPPASSALLARLRAVISGETVPPAAAATAATTVKEAVRSAVAAPAVGEGPDWHAFYNSITSVPAPQPERSADKPYGRRASDDPAAPDEVPTGRRATDRVAVAQRETTIRIDTSRLDQVLNLSGELGLAKNRLTCLRQDLLAGRTTPDALRDIDEAVNQLDLVVGDLQRAVMKTRMQPIGRLFQKYPRMARDLSRSLGKQVELELEGEDTELDRAMIDDLGDPLIHLVRNAVDHGVEMPAERVAAGKPALSTVRLSARQEGDHVTIEIRDDGRGMNPEVLRRKAMEKGLIDADAANRLDGNQSLHLVFLPGFSTKDAVSNISGRGVGMDVVKTAIEKLNGRIDIESEIGVGTIFRIQLPLTLAILPVLVVRHAGQPFAVPLGMVHEIITLESQSIQRVGGAATIVVRDNVLSVRSLGSLLGWPSNEKPKYGCLMQTSTSAFVLAVDDYVGREDVVIKPLTDIKPEGVAGATLAGDGSVVLVLDIDPLLRAAPIEPAEAFAA
jgi:two-component system chemotaxis sensor kinase CheA